MAMYGADPIPTRTPVAHPLPPQLAAGDPVRLIGLPGDLAAHAQLEGAYGRVLRVSGQSVMLEMDEPYMAGGLEHRTFYAAPYQLKRAEVTGRMGARDLYDDEDSDSDA
jgi:hypothetical protein